MAKATRPEGEDGKPKIPLTELKRTIREEIAILPGWDKEDDQAALVMLAPSSIGTRDPVAVRKFTGVPMRFIREYYERIDDNAVLRPGEMAAATWADPIDGNHYFMLDVWVATGKLKRAKQRVGLIPSSDTMQ